MADTAANPRARTLASALRRARTEAGFGVREVARTLNMSHTTISQWETGKRVPALADLTAMLIAIGLPEQRQAAAHRPGQRPAVTQRQTHPRRPVPRRGDGVRADRSRDRRVEPAGHPRPAPDRRLRDRGDRRRRRADQGRGAGQGRTAAEQASHPRRRVHRADRRMGAAPAGRRRRRSRSSSSNAWSRCVDHGAGGADRHRLAPGPDRPVHPLPLRRRRLLVYLRAAFGYDDAEVTPYKVASARFRRLALSPADSVAFINTVIKKLEKTAARRSPGPKKG